MNFEKAIRDVIYSVPSEMFFDVHTIVEKLLQEHDDVYLMNTGKYTSASQYHSKISTIIAHNDDIAEKVGKSFSRNIHGKFSECYLFKRKKHQSAATAGQRTGENKVEESDNRDQPESQPVRAALY